MKKKLNIIVLLSLIVLTLFTFGCKKEVEAGADVRAWNILAQDGACGDRAVTLEVTKGDITWFCWTVHQADGGYIQTPGDGSYDIYEWDDSDKTDHFDENKKVNDITTLKNGKIYIFDFHVEGTYDLYIHQPAAEKSAGGTKDFRGKVKVEGNTVHLKDTGYKDITGKNVEVYIYNDEPNSGSFWKGGDYTVTELWPLVLDTPDKDGGSGSGSIWKVDQSLKYTGLSFSNVKTAGWLFPCEVDQELLIAMYQPNRGTGTPKQDSTKDQQTENLNTYFGKLISYSKIPDNRKLSSANSSTFNDKKFLKDDVLFTAKSALGTIDYYTVTDVPEGMTK